MHEFDLENLSDEEVIDIYNNILDGGGSEFIAGQPVCDGGFYANLKSKGTMIPHNYSNGDGYNTQGGQYYITYYDNDFTCYIKWDCRVNMSNRDSTCGPPLYDCHGYCYYAK